MSVTTMSRAEEGTAAEEPKKSKKKLMAVGLVLAVVAAAYWFLMKPAPAEDAEPQPGAVMVLEPIQVNLAAGHYLKIGIGLQASAEVHEDLDGSKALDSTIELFSGVPIEDLSLAKDRAQMKKKLLRDLEERYHGDVLDVYFTEFVTQ